MGEFTGEFYKTLKNILHKLFQKIAEEERLSRSFFKAIIILIPKPDEDTKENYRSINIPNEHGCKILNKILGN